ncbi:ATP-binding protein [Rufibacter glacialis]|uniref:histidine kinase n=1 Tax=Rufibacter glacialis TaxID=1259555 RepID=A0A5M8QHB2_9BACT|nr:HAMP domain-containing sensor histidine kinase [Rufibacter glacialis]KAA6434608.1 HAMP domain-containing histidine kinase [Rufibacter glacialis]GGK70918.1 hypothetical protein GCM10011405_18930 [Rufibacter glacialis]
MNSQDPSCQQQLEALKEEYEEFAYIVSHDLKAPLRAIHNLSAWIREDLGEGLDPDIQNNIHLLQHRTERLERMINGLLLFSRVPRYDLEVREVNVENLVTQWVADQGPDVPAKVHTAHLPTFTTYARKLETVLHHLLQNALKFNTQDTPEVWVEAAEQESQYVFTVKDNGIGIPPDSHSKVFKIFYSVQPKEQQENLGVGLSISRKIIQFVGGSISLESEAGQGATFTFTWPKTVKEPAL